MYKAYDKAMKLSTFFTTHDWYMKNENFQLLSRGLHAVEQEVIYILD